MNTYMLFYVIPYFLGIPFSINRRGSFGYSTRKSIVLTLILLPIGFIAAKLWYQIENFGVPFSLRVGFSFYGTVLFVPLEQIATAKIAKVPYDDLMDFTAPYGALCLGINRVGCMLNGCCGAAPIIVRGYEVTPPIQLIECILDLLLFLFLLYREKTGRILVKGEQTCVFTICYAFIRLVMEFYRDTPKIRLGMSNGQWLAILTALAAYIVLNILRSRLIHKYDVPDDVNV